MTFLEAKILKQIIQKKGETNVFLNFDKDNYGPGDKIQLKYTELKSLDLMHFLVK